MSSSFAIPRTTMWGPSDDVSLSRGLNRYLTDFELFKYPFPGVYRGQSVAEDDCCVVQWKDGSPIGSLEFKAFGQTWMSVPKKLLLENRVPLPMVKSGTDSLIPMMHVKDPNYAVFYSTTVAHCVSCTSVLDNIVTELREICKSTKDCDMKQAVEITLGQMDKRVVELREVMVLSDGHHNIDGQRITVVLANAGIVSPLQYMSRQVCLVDFHPLSGRKKPLPFSTKLVGQPFTVAETDDMRDRGGVPVSAAIAHAGSGPNNNKKMKLSNDGNSTRPRTRSRAREEEHKDLPHKPHSGATGAAGSASASAVPLTYVPLDARAKLYFG
jgi:hypothetical protein